MIVLENWLNTARCAYSYFDDITSAEDEAIRIMDTLPFKWTRADFTDDHFSYAKAPAIGSCRIYIRFYESSNVPVCDMCETKVRYETRRGKFCESCYEKEYSSS